MLFRRSLVAVCAVAAALLPVCVVGHADPHPLSLVHVENIMSAPASAANIKIAAEVLHGVGETVTVAWNGMPSQHNFDWVGVWSPKPDNYTTTAPSKYKCTLRPVAAARNCPLCVEA